VARCAGRRLRLAQGVKYPSAHLAAALRVNVIASSDSGASSVASSARQR
jgi:hypothetical protein